MGPPLVDTAPPSVDIRYNAEKGVFEVDFSEVAYKGGILITEKNLKDILFLDNLLDDSSLEITQDSQDPTLFIIKFNPKDPTRAVSVTIKDSSYTDKNGNLGTGDVDRHLPPKVVNDSDSVTESGMLDSNTSVTGKAIATGNVLTNDESGTTVVGFTYKGQTYPAGTSVPTTYGSIIIDAQGNYTYQLDNMNPATQALKQGESVLDQITYTVADAGGNQSTAELNITVNGTNDVPNITQIEPAIIPVITGNNSNGSFSNGTITNGSSTAEKKHNFKFDLSDAKDTTTTQVVVNLTTLDNSFKINVNGKSIHPKDVFQIQDGALTTAAEVKLVFADGSYLSAGQPWNANTNGLPRFQIIMTEDGIRFFATRTTSSTQLEEIFFKDTADMALLVKPDFINGTNSIDIINVDGVGVDAMSGFMTVTARGKFEISDVDSADLSKIVVTVKNAATGDLFIPVLPKGISASSSWVGGKLVLTLSGNASKQDYEDALNSLMFKGSKVGMRDIQVQTYDDNGAFFIVDGTLNYIGGNNFATLTQADFTTQGASSAKAILSSFAMTDTDDIIFKLLSDDNLGGNKLETHHDFNLATSKAIDVSALLSSSATSENISEYLTVTYDAMKDQAVISIDRDGKNTHYQTEDLLILTNQSTNVTLEELLKNNQIII